jgi:hypothetical protein
MTNGASLLGYCGAAEGFGHDFDRLRAREVDCADAKIRHSVNTAPLRFQFGGDNFFCPLIRAVSD